MKSLINVLTSRPSLERQFYIESLVKDIQSSKNIDELKKMAEELLRSNAKQSDFIASALEIMCSQQEMLIHYDRRRNIKKKAPLMKRLKYILFGKD
jgi:predicted RND superfamily exporter protein